MGRVVCHQGERFPVRRLERDHVNGRVGDPRPANNIFLTVSRIHLRNVAFRAGKIGVHRHGGPFLHDEAAAVNVFRVEIFPPRDAGVLAVLERLHDRLDQFFTEEGRVVLVHRRPMELHQRRARVAVRRGDHDPVFSQRDLLHDLVFGPLDDLAGNDAGVGRRHGDLGLAVIDHDRADVKRVGHSAAVPRGETPVHHARELGRGGIHHGRTDLEELRMSGLLSKKGNHERKKTQGENQKMGGARHKKLLGLKWGRKRSLLTVQTAL